MEVIESVETRQQGRGMKQIQKHEMFLLFTENQILFSWGERILGEKKF